MLDTPQIIDLTFSGTRHFFYVYRYTTDQELVDALHRDAVTDPKAYEKDVLAYTDCYPTGEEAGRMYLLNKSVDTLAHEAVHMALGILSRSGAKQLTITTDEAPATEEHLCQLVGAITSELYSHSKHF
jgi:hypothetical protein